MTDVVRPPQRHGALIRSIALQAALILIVVALAGAAAYNAADNLARANIAHGFGFWNNTAGFDISQTLIELFIERIDLRPRVLGRFAQHLAGVRARYRAGNDPRLHRRAGAAVA